MKYLWLYEEAFAMKAQEVLQITLPDKKTAEAARMSLLKVARKTGPEMTPPRTWQAYLAPAEAPAPVDAPAEGTEPGHPPKPQRPQRFTTEGH